MIAVRRPSTVGFWIDDQDFADVAGDGAALERENPLVFGGEAVEARPRAHVRSVARWSTRAHHRWRRARAREARQRLRNSATMTTGGTTHHADSPRLVSTALTARPTVTAA